MIALLLFINFLTQPFSFGFSNAVISDTSLTFQVEQENIFLQDRETQLKNIIIEDNLNYFLPHILLSLGKTGIEVSDFSENTLNEIKNSIRDMTSPLVYDLLTGINLTHEDFKPIIKKVTDIIFEYELDTEDLIQTSKFFFEDISGYLDHFIRDKDGRTFYIWNTSGIERGVIEEYFLLKNYNSPASIYNLTSNIFQEEKLVNGEDVFDQPDYNRKKKDVYEILNFSGANSEEISYIQAKALKLSGYETKIVSLPVMFDNIGTKKITFCMFKDKNTDIWHALGNDIFLNVLAQTDISVNESGYTIDRFRNVREFASVLKEVYPDSGLVFITNSPQIDSTSMDYYTDQVYIDSFLESLHWNSQETTIELVGLEKALDMVTETRLIEILNGIQLFPESMSKLVSKIILSTDGKKPGFFTFPIYDDIVWIQPRVSFSTIGLVMDLFTGTLDVLKEYIKNPHRLRTKIIEDIQESNSNLAEKYFHIKEKYFNNMEYGNLSSDWIYTCENNGICYMNPD